MLPWPSAERLTVLNGIRLGQAHECSMTMGIVVSIQMSLRLLRWCEGLRVLLESTGEGKVGGRAEEHGNAGYRRGVQNAILRPPPEAANSPNASLPKIIGARKQYSSPCPPPRLLNYQHGC